jgi:ZIP family zinc transporter
MQGDGDIRVSFPPDTGSSEREGLLSERLLEAVVGFHPVIQALLGTGFTWGVTALGASTVFLERQFNRKILDWLLGFAGGVMIAASYWSLLSPAIEIAREQLIPA